MRWALTAFFLLIGILAACTERSGNPQQGIKIGAVASLTGPAGEQGQNWLNGALLAVDEAAASGVKVDLLVEDDGTVPAKAAAAFQKLASVNKVKGVLGGTWDFVAEPLYPLSKQHNIPFVALTNPIEIIPKFAVDGGLTFTNAMGMELQESLVMKFLSSKKVSKIAVIYPNVPFGEIHSRMFQSVAKKSDLKIILDGAFNAGPTYLDEIRTYALKAVAAKPDMIFAVLDYAGVDLFLGELSQLRSDIPLLTTQHLDAAFEFTKYPQRYKNVYGIYPKIRDVGFFDRYRSKFGLSPKVYAAAGYDAVNFMIRFADGGSFNFDGAQGEVFFPAKNGVICNVEPELFTIRDGKFSPVSPH